MKFISLAPFVPSGSDFAKSRELFLELGFAISWEEAAYVSFQKDGCRFILQKFDKADFAHNFMLSVAIDNAEEFRNNVIEKKLPEKFGIRIGKVTQEPYGREVNMIDIAGVCWHFIEQ